MARKPVDLTATNGSPRQQMWEAIRARTGQPFTIRDLTWNTQGLHKDSIRSYLLALEKAGIVARAELTGMPKRQRWQLVKDHGLEAPRVNRTGTIVTQGRGRENMWRVIRMSNSDFSWRDLAIMASTEETLIAENEALDYCHSLNKAGYLTLVQMGKGQGNPTIYRFNRAMNTGPLPPMIQRIKSVWDQNLRKIVWHAEVEND